MEIFDIAIIGLGPAGHKATLKALKNGYKVIAFEKSSVGGTCLNLGCIPTKALLHSSEIFAELKCLDKSGFIGISDCIADKFSNIDFKDIFTRKNKIVEKFSSAVKKDLLSKGLVLIEKEAQIKENSTNNSECNFSIIADETEYLANKIIIATGSAPYQLDNLKFDHKNILSSDDVLNLDEIPKSIAIVGSGAIGIEWARIFSNLGTKVYVIEKAEDLLPTADLDVSKRISRMFKMAKIQAYSGVTVEKFENGVAMLSNGSKIECTKILVAVGRKRIIPKIKFKNPDTMLTINTDGTTNFEGIYAAGDVYSKKMLAHTASTQAARLLESFCNKEYKPVFDDEIPSVIYGTPEIASIGLREQDLPNNYKDNSEYKIYNLQIAYLAKAWCDNEIEGFIKIITRNNRILGAHIISKEASSLITQIQIAMKANMDIDELKEVVFAHPTYSEGILEALEQ